MTYHLDIETFICEVQKYPQIWDSNHSDHKHQGKKQQAWSAIARICITDFENMPELERTEVYRKLYGKWRNIRDSYARYTRRKHNSGRGSYLYAKYLTFLDNLYKINQSDSGAENSENENQSDEDYEKIKKIHLKSRKLKLLDESNMWDSDNQDPMSTIENLKRKRYIKKDSDTSDKESVEMPTAAATVCYTNEEDDNRSFFESLLPVVREFDMDQRLEFRSQVLCLIKNIRSTNRSKQTEMYE